METHAFGFRLRANAPEGQKRFPISYFLPDTSRVGRLPQSSNLLAFSEEIPKQIAFGSKWLPTMHDLDAWAIAPFALLAVILFGVGSSRPKPE